MNADDPRAAPTHPGPGRRAVLLAATLIALGADDALAPRLDRLAAMPPATRQELAEQLRRFDALPEAERRAIRDLDAAIEGLDPEEHRRLVELLRRYGSWFRSLEPAEQRRLLEAAPSARIAVVRELMAPDATADPGLDPALWTRSAAFNPMPMYDVLYALRVWAQLDKDARERLELARFAPDPIAALTAAGRDRGIAHAPTIRQRFGAVLDEFRRTSLIGPLRSARLPVNLEAWLLDAAPPRSPEGLAPPPGRRGEPGGPPRAVAARDALLRVAELLLTEYSPRAEPPAGGSDELVTFEAKLPEWYRETLDPLPPEILRRRLALLRSFTAEDESIESWLETVPATTPTPSPSRPTGPVRVTPF